MDENELGNGHTSIAFVQNGYKWPLSGLGCPSLAASALPFVEKNGKTEGYIFWRGHKSLFFLVNKSIAANPQNCTIVACLHFRNLALYKVFQSLLNPLQITLSPPLLLLFLIVREPPW